MDTTLGYPSPSSLGVVRTSSPEFKTQKAKKLELLLENSFKTIQETKRPVPDARCDQLLSLIHEILNKEANGDNNQAEVEEAATNVAYLANGVGFTIIAGLDQHQSSSQSKIQQRREKALDLFSVALKIHRETYGEADSPVLASSISNVGVACLSLGRSHEAVNLLREALDIRKRLVSSSSSSNNNNVVGAADVVASQYTLGTALLAAKNPEAAPMLRQAIADYSNLPKSSPATIAKWERDLKEAEKL